MLLPARPLLRSCALALVLAFAGMAPVLAQYSPPTGYYSTAEGLSGSALQTALHNIIDGHTKLSYAGVWTALQTLDQDPANANNILCVYWNRSIPKADRDGSTSASIKWNREHSWPKSYGFDTESWPAYTDVNHLYASYANYNSARGNKYFDWSTGSTYAVIGTTSVNKADTDSWEVWDQMRGDLARSMLYMAVRYSGDVSNEPDLILNDSATVTGQPRMAKLTTLLEWHAGDPVNDRERRRNHLVYTNYQGNRNPFVDRPEWVNAIWGGGTPPPPPPPPPTGPTALTSGTAVTPTVTQGQWLHYTIAVPSNGTALSVVMSGTGDADVYVRRGSQPTSTAYDFRPYANGSAETVTVNGTSSPALVASSTYYISVNGYAASSAITLTATVSTGTTPPPPPTTGTMVSGQSKTLTVAQGSWKNETIFVPTGSTQLRVVMTGSGDGDLYVRRGSQPTLSAYDFRPYLGTSAETVTANGTSSPVLQAGQMYYIAVYGYAASTVTITTTIN